MSEKIGIPRSLLYYYYYPAWEAFFQELGYQVVLSPPTNKGILDDGVRLAVDDLCLPFKVYFGHIKWLLDRVDHLFIPRLISFGKGNRFCPKFMGLPDMIKSVFSNKKLPYIIEPIVDNKNKLLPFHQITQELGKQLGYGFLKTEQAYWKAFKKQKEYDRFRKRNHTSNEALDLVKNRKKQNNLEKNTKTKLRIKENKKGITVVLLGHSYIINDKYMSMGLYDHLEEFNVNYITTEMFAEKEIEKAAKSQGKTSFWYFNRHILGTAYYYLNNDDFKKDVDGFIQVTAFGCGPDSLITQLIDLKGKSDKDISILNINLDEHSGRAGLKTRLEAFIDLLERRKRA